MRILVLAPHPDDECIGCGGAICLHVQQRQQVAAVFFTSGELGLKQLDPNEARQIREHETAKAARVLGIEKLYFFRCRDSKLAEDSIQAIACLSEVLRTELPDVVYCPHEQEWHPDHKAVLPILRAALANCPGLQPCIRCYEVWTPTAKLDRVENITRVIQRKLLALRQHQSQLQDLDYVRAVRGLNIYRGGLAGRCKYAEVFESAG